MATIIGRGKFGVEATDTLTQNLTITHTSDQAELRDKDGEYVGIAIYGKRKEVEVEVAIDTNGSAATPAVGSSYSVGGVTGYVTQVVEKSSNQEFATYSITLVSYESISSGS